MSRQRANRTIFNLLLEIGTAKALVVVEGLVTANNKYKNLDELIQQETNDLNKGYGEALYDRQTKQPILSADKIDVVGLCFILRNSPSLGLASDKMWNQTSTKLPFVGTSEVQCCLVIKSIRNEIHGHKTEINTLSDEPAYFNNASRLYHNIIELTHNKQWLDEQISSMVQTMNTSIAMATDECRVESIGGGEESTFSQESICEKLEKIFNENSVIEVSIYMYDLRLRGALTDHDITDLKNAPYNTHQKLILAKGLAVNGVNGVKALYELAKKNKHVELINSLKTEFKFS